MTQLPGFADGDVSVQDAAAQRAAPLLLGAAARRRRARARRLRRARRQDRAPARARRSRPARASTATRRAWPASTRRWPASACARARSPPTPREPAAWWDGRAVRRHPARRAVQRFGHRAPPPRRALAAPRRRHRRAGGDPGAPARRALAAARARRPAALLHLLGVPGRGPATRSTLFCNDKATPPSPRHPPSPGHLLPLPDNRAAPPAPASSAAADGFFLRPDREDYRATLHDRRDDPAAAARLVAPPQPAARARRRGVASAGRSAALARRRCRSPAGRAAAEPPSSPPSTHPRRRRRATSATRSTSSSAAASTTRCMKAVPLFFVAEAEIFRDRWYWRDRRVAHAVRVWRIVYQPLTSTYRVTTVGGLSQNYADARRGARRDQPQLALEDRRAGPDRGRRAPLRRVPLPARHHAAAAADADRHQRPARLAARRQAHAAHQLKT